MKLALALLMVTAPLTAAAASGVSTAVSPPAPVVLTGAPLDSGQARNLATAIRRLPRGDARRAALQLELAHLHHRAGVATTGRTSRRHLAAAEGLYKKLSSDTALWSYAQLALLRGDRKLAARLWPRLVKQHPASPLVPHAYLALADSTFAGGQHAAAKALYAKVQTLQPRGLGGYATFRLGWVALAEKRYADALSLFFQVHARVKRTDAPLADACRDAFVIAYADVGKAQRAHAAFRRLDKTRADDMQLQLAELYLDRGAAAKAVYSFRELLRRLPKDVRACDWQGHVARQMAAVGSPKQARQERERLIKLGQVRNDQRCLDLAAALPSP